MRGRSEDRPVVLLLLAVTVLNLYNAARYTTRFGYDVDIQEAYALDVFRHFRVPWSLFSTHTPPGWHVIAGALEEVGGWRLVQLANAPFVLGGATAFWLLLRRIFPERRWLHFSAIAFYCLIPVVPRLAAMAHPDTLSLLAGTLVLLLAVRVVLKDSPTIVDYALVGLALGLGQWVRTTLVPLGVVVIVVLAIDAAKRVPKTRVIFGGVALALGLSVLVPLPWYLKVNSRYGTPFHLNAQEPTTSFFKRRDAAFLFDPRATEIAMHPVRPYFSQRLIPVLYTDLWGDYFGYFIWHGDSVYPTAILNPFAGGQHTPGAAQKRLILRSQMVVGLLATLLSVGGVVALARRAARQLTRSSVARAQMLVLASGAVVMLADLYFVWRYPTTDGVELKANYALLSLPAWALGFGYAVWAVSGRLRPTARRIFIGAVIVCGVVTAVGADVFRDIFRPL